jgi:predicted DNA-binding ArsR family transcriptional regulator
MALRRIKIINEPTELVPMLRAVDTPVKREVLKEVTRKWCTAREIEEKYGKEGKEALLFFEKMKLVETMWQTMDNNMQEKTYHTYYMSFHINTSCPITEISDVLSIAVMSNEDFAKLEDEIYQMVGEKGMFAGDITERKNMSSTMLKSVVKRSAKLEYRGHRVERAKE